METNPINKYQTMKRALVSPLEKIDMIYDLIANWLDTSDQLNLEILR
jgi:hypothetical protein